VDIRASPFLPLALESQGVKPLVKQNQEKGRLAMLRKRIERTGNTRWGLIALLLGLPLPIVLLAFLFMGGCR
jgi:hypothetical protein